jgi:hypothetical protein
LAEELEDTAGAARRLQLQAEFVSENDLPLEESNVIATALNTSPLVLLFPFVGMAYDYELPRVHNKQENKIMFGLKIFIYTYFWFIMAAAWIV